MEYKTKLDYIISFLYLNPENFKKEQYKFQIDKIKNESF